MLAMFQSDCDPDRPLIGVDISPRMIAHAEEQIGKDALLIVGDMRSLPEIDNGSAAGLINFFAVHHIDSEGIHLAMSEWYRILVQNAYLVLAAWEGKGAIDYGEESDIVALRYTSEDLSTIARQVGFSITRCEVEPVEGFPMKAVYLEAKKLRMSLND
jgi:ubiquinone/menaquinone biosynthesis C-methylase UbiE